MNFQAWDAAGLPDGLFSDQKSQFEYILEVFRLENVDIFWVHLEYLTDVWDILRHFVLIW
jgi:hypothetical protein